MISFAKRVKKELTEYGARLKSCCGYSLLYGILFCGEVYDGTVSLKCLNHEIGQHFVSLCEQLSVKKEFEYKYEKNRIMISNSFLRYESYEKIKKNVLRCGRCKEMFLRGVFLACGTVNDPNKSYRLELVFNNEDKAEQIFCVLNDVGIQPLRTKRNDKFVLYLKRSEAIEDFFASIGATSLAFDIMNSKINKELINNANRVTNCDAANINKSILASNKYNTVIEQMIEAEAINRLPEHLREMAVKRIEHKELSFTELGKQFSPPISKSGVYHRLEKILEYYNEFENKD
ncbi:MAG: DNA-binding protein WhiA [Clostridia bacterium]|nr:DNA-binding protein WhiA [Clostridia bacterium]